RALHPSPERGGWRAKRAGWGSKSRRSQKETPPDPPSLRSGGPPSPFRGGISPTAAARESFFRVGGVGRLADAVELEAVALVHELQNIRHRIDRVLVGEQDVDVIE